MNLLSILPILIIFLIFPSFVSSKCPSEWTTRVDSDGNTYGYLALISDLINIFQANALCRERGGDIVSIHSEEENNFVGSLAAPLIKQCQETNACAQRVDHETPEKELLDRLYRSFWIGFSRVQYAPPFLNSSVQCINTDGTSCDYGRVDGVAAHDRNVTPWGFGNPSGLSDQSEKRSNEGCTEMYIGNNSEPFWNDISCYALLGGVICKRNCSQTCKEEDKETTAATTTTELATTQVTNICLNNTVCGVDGWKWHCNEKKTKCNSYHKYTLPSKGNYWEAGAICRKHGAYVASIKSKQENVFVQENYCACNNTSHWIGNYRVQKSDNKIDCLDEEGDPCYITDNKTSDHPWAKNSPAKNVKEMNDGIYGTKNCVMMKNSQWQDVACARPLGEVLCKKTCISPDF